MLFRELLGEVDAVQRLERVLLVLSVEASIPDFMKFAHQIDNELLDVGHLNFLQPNNFEFELREDRFTVALLS